MNKIELFIYLNFSVTIQIFVKNKNSIQLAKFFFNWPKFFCILYNYLIEKFNKNPFFGHGQTGWATPIRHFFNGI